MKLTESLNVRGATDLLGRATPAAVQAISMAGGDAIRAMRTESSRRVRERKAFKAGALSEKLKIIWPTGNDEKLWRLRIPAENMPVWALGGARPTSKGVTVAINAGKRVLISGAFIAEMKSGHVGIFRRYGAASRAPVQRYKGKSRYAGQRRQQIKELYTTRVVDVFRDTGFSPAILSRGRDVFLNTYNRVLPLQLAKH
jgi:hypothetical protein